MSVLLLSPVFNPLADWPVGETGCLPPADLPSPPPCGWSTGFLTTPLVWGFLPNHLDLPALPILIFFWSGLLKTPIVAKDLESIFLTSPEASLIKLASGEVRKIDSRSLATIGVLSNPDQKNIKIGKAGRSRWLGRKPHTRGVVKNPVDHPHGGGEGKSAGGRHPVSPTGQSAKGLKTGDNKRTDKYIVKRRNKRKDTK